MYGVNSPCLEVALFSDLNVFSQMLPFHLSFQSVGFLSNRTPIHSIGGLLMHSQVYQGVGAIQWMLNNAFIGLIIYSLLHQGRRGRTVNGLGPERRKAGRQLQR